MKELCDYIDQYFKDNLSCPGFKFYGLSELVLKGTQIHPVTVNGREQVAINDKYDGIVFHRWIGTPSEDSDEFSFGANIKKLYSARIRTILAFKVAKFAEKFVIDFANALPLVPDVTGFDMVNMSESVVINTNQETIYKEEFGADNYEKHMLPWNIYAIEHDVDFIKC